MSMDNFADHTNPEIISSVRTTIPLKDHMLRYHGDIKRNIDSAYILCGKVEDDGVCRGVLGAECPFHSDYNICLLVRLMMLVGREEL